ncbi:MAG: cytochrome c biogenesis protein ResB [Chloroflexi bacterium]|nr:cytochrome c biogenesis protein ResB [Chloroflexota bacterium]
MANARSQILRRTWRFLRRLDLAAVLILVVLLLAALGSCFPQLSAPVAADPERLAHWAASVRARYGTIADSLAASGVFNYASSPVFLVPIALLATLTLVCTLDRWRGVWRRAFHQPVRCSDDTFDTAPHTAQLTASAATDLPEVTRKSLKQRGFSVRSETDGEVCFIRGDRNRLSPLATLVTHLAVLLLLVGAVLSRGYGWREEISIGPGEMVPVEHESDWAVRNDGFVISRYPDGSASGYTAQVTVIEGNREAMRGSVRGNEPLVYNSIGLHLRGYAGTEGQHTVTLLAVRDPGYGLVIVAGFLLLLGPTVSFHFPHCRVYARIEPEGTLLLAGRADKQAYDFVCEFTALVKEIARDRIAKQNKE